MSTNIPIEGILIELFRYIDCKQKFAVTENKNYTHLSHLGYVSENRKHFYIGGNFQYNSYSTIFYIMRWCLNGKYLNTNPNIAYK